MLVKGNPPQLQHDIHLVFPDPSTVGEARALIETVESGPGRLEERRLTASTVLTGYSDGPGLAQVFALERRVTRKKRGAQHHEVVDGITSLGPARADPACLLHLVRGHWQIENRGHGVRDVTFEEERSHVRWGSIPQVMAAVRNTAIGLMHWAGETHIAAACRRFAAQPSLALAMIGITLEN